MSAHPHAPSWAATQRGPSTYTPPSEHPQQASTQRNSSFQPYARDATSSPSASSPHPPSTSDSDQHHRRTQSLRPFSALQPMDSAGGGGGGGGAGGAPSPAPPRRPPSPTGSTTQSIRSAAAPLTFKSPELRSALSLQDAQQRKIYMEGYLSRRDALGTDGRPLKPHDPRRSWHLCFVQLSGTVLSVWSVREMEQAAREGREVPPSYVNVTDSFVDLIGNLIEDPNEVPGSRGRYENVFALNSAGNNRILFCVEGAVGRRLVQAWINAIRLASWEKVRLEEIYTGALIRARLGAVGSSNGGDASPSGPPRPMPNLTIASPLAAKGRMEGWVKARFMGSTEWKKCWLVLTKDKPEDSSGSGAKKFWRNSILGGFGSKDKEGGGGSAGSHGMPSSTAPPPLSDRNSLARTSSIMSLYPDMEPPPGNNGATGVAQFFASKKDKKPMSTLIFAAHTFAVYPSRPELVEGSSLFKVEGAFPQSQVLSATNRIRQTGWVMIMPEIDAAGSKGANAEMMKWVIAFVDAFKLYGRPEGFNWDARSPTSAFFAYPIGQFKDRLFLDRELAEFLDVREERHLASRANLHGIMAARMRGERTPILPPLPTPNAKHTQQLNGRSAGAGDEGAGGGGGGDRAGGGSGGDRAGARGDRNDVDAADADADGITPKATPAMAASKTLPPLDFGGGSDRGGSANAHGEQPQQQQQPPTNGNHHHHPASSQLDTIGERSREGSTLTLPSPAGMQHYGSAQRDGSSQVSHGSGGANKPTLSVDPNYERGSGGNGGEYATAGAAAAAPAAAAAGSVHRQGSLASNSTRTRDPRDQRPGSSRGSVRTSATASGALSPPPSQQAQLYGDGAAADRGLHAKSPSPVPSYHTGAAPAPAPAPASRDNAENASVRSHPQQQQFSPPTRQESLRSQPQHTLAPSGRGAEADPATTTTTTAPRTPAVAADRRSDADFASNYDEGALFYLRSMSDQLPAPVAAAVAQQRAASDGQQRSAPREVEEQPSSAVADTPSTYTQPSYAPSPADEFSRQPSLRRGGAAGVPSTVREDNNPDRFDEDALAAYSYLDQPPSPTALARGQSFSRGNASGGGGGGAGGVNGDNARAAAPAGQQQPPAVPAGVVPAAAAASGVGAASYPSTFGQNKRAQDRKEAAQAQAAAHAAALTTPGGRKKKTSTRGGGAFKNKGGAAAAGRRHAWGEESSEDDDDEEEEEEDDDEEEEERRRAAASGPRQSQQPAQSYPAAEEAARTAAAAGLPPPGMAAGPAHGGTSSIDGSASRASRSSGRSSPAGASPTTQYQQQQYAQQQQQQQQQRAGGIHPALVNQRQSMFNSHLAAPHGSEDDARSISPNSQSAYGGYTSGGASVGAGGGASPYAPQPQTFVQLNPNEQPGSMTAVFQPHGLLQAGAQDKAERSAKQQEFEARQAGVGMVNVPNKPPPPQAGLLGAISAHERDRKGAGGLGATLTERERQRVEAERRQREEDAMRAGMGGAGMPGMGMGSPAMGMMPGGMNPWAFNPYMWQQQMQMMMMGGAGGSQMGGHGSQVGHGGGGGSGGGSSSPPPGMDPYQHQQMQMQQQMQQQMAAAMMAQQAAYMQAMSAQGGNDQQQQRPMSMSPGMPSMPSMPSMMPGMPHPMSMYGMPAFGMPGTPAMSEFGAYGGQQQQQASPQSYSRQPQRRTDSSSGDVRNGNNGSPLKR